MIGRVRDRDDCKVFFQTLEGLSTYELTGAMTAFKRSVQVQNRQNLTKEEVVDPDDVEMLEDLVMAATNEALRMAEEANSEVMGKMAGGLGLGGGLPF